MSIQASHTSPMTTGRSSSVWTVRTWTRLFIVLIVISPLLVRMWFVSKVPYIKEPFDVHAFCRLDVPAGENAFDHYRKAERLFEAARLADIARNDPDPSAQIIQVLENGWDVVVGSERLGTWFEARRAALQKWRRGTELSDARYQPIRESHWETLLPVTQALRSFAQMAECEAMRLEGQGEFGEALNWHLAVVRCGYHSGKRGFVIERLVGCALHAIAEQGLVRWSEYPGVTSEQIRKAIDEIQVAERMSTPMSDTLKVEYITTMNSFDRPSWIRACDLAKGSAAEEPLVSGLKIFYWLVGEPHRTRMAFRHLLANQLTEIDKPVVERHPYANQGKQLVFDPGEAVPLQPNQLSPEEIVRAIQRSPITTVFPTFCKDLDVALQKQKSRQAALIVALAAQAYQRDHQEYPQELDELVPGYLDAIPIDPSDLQGKAIRYRRESPKSALVWSVGPDGKDDTVDPDLARKLGFGIELKTR